MKTEMIRSIVVSMLLVIPLNNIWNHKKELPDTGFQKPSALTLSEVEELKITRVVALSDATFVEPAFNAALAVADPELLSTGRRAYIRKAEEEQDWGFRKSMAVIPEVLQSREYKRKRKKVALGEFYKA